MAYYYIYIIVDPRVEGILGVRYVGQTVDSINKRLTTHINTPKKDRSRRANWIRSLLEVGIKPDIIEIDRVELDDVDDAEILYIREYRALGCPLTNSDSGGNKNKHLSDEHRAKLSAAKVGKRASEETRAKLSLSHMGQVPWNKGVPTPKETREKIAKSRKGKPQTEEGKAKISISMMGHKRNLGLKQSQETIEKRIAKLRGKKQAPEVVEKRAANLRGKKASEQAKANMSIAHIGKKASEETRQRMSNSQTKRRQAEKEIKNAATGN